MKLNLSILLILIAILTNAQDVQEIYLKTKYKKAIFKGFAKYKRTTTTYNDSTVTVLKNLTKNNLVNKKVEYSKDNRVIESEYFYNGNLRIRTHFKNDRIEKKENYTLITADENSFSDFFSNFSNELNSFEKEHVFVQLSENLNTTQQDISLFLNIAEDFKKNGTTFVLIFSEADIDDFPEEFNITPTLIEAE
ncbi:MAG: hypothetical protein ACPGVD_05210, partial [Flavobacteriales bacterium]